MSATECFKHLLMSEWDIFVWGVFVGGFIVTIFRVFEKWLEVKFLTDKKKLDIMLGEYLVSLKNQINDPFINKKARELMNDDG